MLNNNDADQPTLKHMLICVFVVRIQQTVGSGVHGCLSNGVWCQVKSILIFCAPTSVGQEKKLPKTTFSTVKICILVIENMRLAFDGCCHGNRKKLYLIECVSETKMNLLTHIHISLSFLLWDICKQCRSRSDARSDAVERGV